MLEAASLREALSVAAPEVDPKTIVIEVGCSEVRVGFAGALRAACRLPAFVSRVPQAHGIQTLYGWEAFGSNSSSNSSSSSYRHVFAAHPAHSASGGSSLDLLLLLLDEALDRALRGAPCCNSDSSSSRRSSSKSSSTDTCNLLLMLPLPGEPQLVPLLLRWAFQQRRFERVKLMATERMVVYSHLPLLPDLCSQRGALVVDVGECGLRVCPIEGASLSPVSFCRASSRSSAQLLSELLLLHLRKKRLSAASAAAAAGGHEWTTGAARRSDAAATAAATTPTTATVAPSVTPAAAKEEQQADTDSQNEAKKLQQQQQKQHAVAAAATHTPAHAFGAGSGRWGPQSLDWRDITKFKETQCYVSLDPALDLHLHRKHRQLRPLFTCSDGSVVQPWSETFLIPEVLFSPQLLPDANLAAVAPSMDHSSISEMVLGCFKRSSVCEREGWLSRICLVGGTAQMPNFAQRVEMDLLQAWTATEGTYFSPKDRIQVQVLPCENRQLAAFRGALLFGLVARQEPEAWLSRSLFDRDEGIDKLARHMALYS